MRQITAEMIEAYKIKQLGYDFMGYSFNKVKELSFHHLIIPRKDSRKQGIGDGYVKWNGAILRQLSSHDYLHLIQRIDNEIFNRITGEMIKQNQKGRLDLENLKIIRDLLLYFEKEHCADEDREGHKIIKKRFITNRIEL